ncbi:MAG: hypothetical protein ACOVOG_08590, partial [Rubrivivax sp.]
MIKAAHATRHLLALATLALGLSAAQASTTAYDAMVASGATVEGIYPRIVIRDDVGLSGSATYAANAAFAGVVGLGYSG